MLKAMVEDMNRYGESPSEVLRYFEHYAVKLIIGSNPTSDAQIIFSGNPLKEVVGIYNSDKETGKYKYHYFSPSHMQNLNTKTHVLQFKNYVGDVLFEGGKILCELWHIASPKCW